MRRLSHSWPFVGIFLAVWLAFAFVPGYLWLIFSFVAVLLYGRDLIEVVLKILKGESHYELARPLLAALVFCSWLAARMLSAKLLMGLLSPRYAPMSQDLLNNVLFVVLLCLGVSAISVLVTLTLLWASVWDRLHNRLASWANHASHREVLTPPKQAVRWQGALLGANLLTLVVFTPLITHVSLSTSEAIAMVEELVLFVDFTPNFQFEYGFYWDDNCRQHEYGMKRDPDLPYDAMVSFTEDGDEIVAEPRDRPITVSVLGTQRPVLSGRYRFYLKKGHPSPSFVDKVVIEKAIGQEGNERPPGLPVTLSPCPSSG
jgi:hypothetical protein